MTTRSNCVHQDRLRQRRKIHELGVDCIGAERLAVVRRVLDRVADGLAKAEAQLLQQALARPVVTLQQLEGVRVQNVQSKWIVADGDGGHSVLLSAATVRPRSSAVWHSTKSSGDMQLGLELPLGAEPTDQQRGGVRDLERRREVADVVPRAGLVDDSRDRLEEALANLDVRAAQRARRGRRGR